MEAMARVLAVGEVMEVMEVMEDMAGVVSVAMAVYSIGCTTDYTICILTVPWEATAQRVVRTAKSIGEAVVPMAARPRVYRRKVTRLLLHRPPPRRSRVKQSHSMTIALR